MAKKSSIEKNNKRKALVKKYAKQRAELKRKAVDTSLDQAARREARDALTLLPKNSNPNRVRNRCATSGRPRGYIRFFGLSRIAFRELAHSGELPGVRKASY